MSYADNEALWHELEHLSETGKLAQWMNANARTDCQRYYCPGCRQTAHSLPDPRCPVCNGTGILLVAR